MDAAKSLTAPPSDPRFAVLIGAFSVGAAAALILVLVDLGPLSAHMAIHVAAMNIAAPLAAVALLPSYLARLPASTSGLWLATTGQLGLLWASHSPALHHAAQSSLLAQLALHGALFFAALAFWSCIVAVSSRWQAMLALLVTGKFACLLGALLIFAPRFLFDAASQAHAHGIAGTPITALADQHLAGLIMIAACPLSYVLTAVVLAAHAMSCLERAHAPPFAGGPVGGS